MKAIILAGGSGTRLRPITDYIPKPLVPIKNIPIIQWQLKYLEKFGIDEVIISTGYKQNMIKNHLDSIKPNIKIKYSHEETPLGTGGAIKKAGELIDADTFFVLNGDIITDIDLTKLCNKPNTIATIQLRTNFGTLEIQDDMVEQFQEKEIIKNQWMNAGIYHLNKEILSELPINGSIEKITFPSFAKQGKLYAEKFLDIHWYSIDSFKDLKECEKMIEKII